jgi:hypothetical protein
MPSALRPLLIILATAQLALGFLMAIDPGTFFEEIGPYAPQNDHYIRDVATFYVAMGLALAIAARRPSWRVPVLTLVLLQYVMHAVNHLVDVGDTDPEALGPVNLALLVATSALLVWMLVTAARDDRRG